MIKKLMTAAALLAMVGTASSATLYTTGVLGRLREVTLERSVPLFP